MIGPKKRPTLALPRLWIMKSPTRMAAANGTTYGLRSGVTISTPSTALSTEMAGVIIASPKNSDAPPRPMIKSALRKPPDLGSTSDSNAMVPPSPSLSARMTIKTYLTATTRMTAQKINDNTPKMTIEFSELPDALMDSRNAYMGLVPMSPKTTPSAPIMRVARAGSEAFASVEETGGETPPARVSFMAFLADPR